MNSRWFVWCPRLGGLINIHVLLQEGFLRGELIITSAELILVTYHDFSIETVLLNTGQSPAT